MRAMSIKQLILAMSVALILASPCYASSAEDKQVGGTILEVGPAQIENAFSPDAKAEELVLKVINTSTSSIKLAAYSFSSPTVVKALLDAKKRGVNIMVLVDYRRTQPEKT